MRKQSSSIDGFVPRRANSQLGEQHAAPISKEERQELGRFGVQHTDEGLPPVEPSNHGLRRSDIDESLQSIDEPEEPPKKRRGLFGRRRNRVVKPASKKRRIIKWAIIVILVIGLGLGVFLGIKTLTASGHIFKGNIFDILQNQPLKQDASGRTNILIFGTSEDDPGHQAAYLTDSIIVLSVDQTKKDAYMFSIPRDLEVEYGEACLSGYRGKINEVYGCNYDDGNDENAGAVALKAKVGEVTGLDIQYYTHVNYTVVREAVGAVGGVTVNIEGDGDTPVGIPAGSVMDSNFDWKCGATYALRLKNCGPRGHFIDYGPGPVELDAEHALYLAQARGDINPTWGLAKSNFDREANQQKIIKALREKALSAGTLTNVGKVSSLIDALGNNLRTSFETKEIGTLVSLAKDIPSDKIQTISLIDGDDAVMNGDGNPKAGKYQFSDIQAFLKESISADPVTKEKAKFVVLNGSSTAGVAQTEATKLEAAGFSAANVSVDNAPKGTYADIEIYQLTASKTATAAKLTSLYGVKPKTTAPPFDVISGTDFVVIFGKPRTTSQ